MAPDSRVKPSPDDLIAAVNAIPEGADFKTRVREVIRDYFRADRPHRSSIPDSSIPTLRKKGAEKK